VRTLIRYLVITYTGYIALSVLVILPALNFLAPGIVRDAVGRELRSEIILFNPFTLTVEIRNFSLIEPRAKDIFVSADRALVNLSLESLWNKGLVLDEVTVESLYVNIIRRLGGEFNFSDMLGEPSTPSDDTSGDIPALTIHKLQLHSRQIKFTDQTQAQSFATHWDGLAVVVAGLSTVREEGRPYSIDVVAEAGGRLHWEGEVSVPGAHSTGKLSLEKLSLRPMWRYAQHWLAFELKEGLLSFSGDYRLDWGDELAYSIKNGQVSLTAIDMVPTDSQALPETGVAVEAIELTGIEVDSPAATVSIGAFTVNGVDVSGFSEGGTVSLASMFETSFPAMQESSAQANNNPGSEKAWKLRAPSIQLDNSELRWRSEFTSPPMLGVSSISAELTDFSWPPVSEVVARLSLSVNDITTVKVDGAVNLDSGDGDIKYKLEKLQLTMLNANLSDGFNAHITQGAVDASGEVKLVAFAPSKLLMDGKTYDFAGSIEGTEEALTSWDSIRWQALDVNFDSRSVYIETISLNGYAGRLHIYEDGSVNAQRVLQQKVEKARAEGTLHEEELRAWSFDIPSIFVSDSALDFSDESLPIKFQTVIGELDGEISGVSSDPDGKITVDIKGSVDGYAPVILAGTAQPFADATLLDMGLSFDGVDLVRLTPYSGTYAGYEIDRGILNLDLHYSLEGNRLKGANSVIINQLKLGDKIDSDKAVDLPLELALALLTDMNGVIDMNVPVEGDLDNPEFGLGSVVASAFVNLITKAITAPFSLLAGLVGSEEDMQRIAFSSGSSELGEVSAAKLADLVAALSQRPGLDLVLFGRLHPSADKENLQKRLLTQELLAGGLSSEDISSKSANWVKAIEKRYKNLQRVTQGETDVSISKQYEQLLATMAVGSAQLQALAQERAAVVKRYLVNELQFPAGRAAIEAVDVNDEANLFSGVELGVDI